MHIYNSRNYLIRIDITLCTLYASIYNSRNYLIRIDYNDRFIPHMKSTIVEIT